MGREETIANVSRLFQKGRLDQAIAKCRNAAYAMREAGLFNLLGDLYLRGGHPQKAIEEYHKAAKLFIKDGDTLKAIGVYKKVLNIDPTDTDALISLGELNAGRNLLSDAIKYYISAAHELSRAKENVHFLRVCKTILELDPDNTALRERIEGLMKSAGEGDEQRRHRDE